MHRLLLLSNPARLAVLALVLLLAGCRKEQPVAASKPEPPWWETNKESQIMRRRAEAGAALLEQADAVLEVIGNSAHFLRPKFTNDLTTPADYEIALRSVERRNSAVIVFQAYDYTGATNEAAQAAAILKQCGFRTVHQAVLGWGMTFPYSEP